MKTRFHVYSNSNEYQVSTVLLSDNSGYETMVFPVLEDGSIDRHNEVDSATAATQVGALANHVAMMNRWL